ncbi:MAG: hypothetical protein ACJAYU_004723, partial [Bradymonadia bacterium]
MHSSTSGAAASLEHRLIRQQSIGANLNGTHFPLVSLIAAVALAACGGETPTSEPSTDVGGEDTAIVDGGETDAAEDAGADIAGDPAEDAGADIAGDPAEDADVEEDVVPDIEEDADVAPDVEEDADSDAVSAPDAISDYIACESRTDCPIGRGDCVTEVLINRVSGRVGDRVTVAEAFGVPELVGVCSRGCTNDGQVGCEGLSIEDSRGRDVGYTCQVVWVDSSAYELVETEFPFDGPLDEDQMALGVQFAALCRPPFQLHADVSGRFCETCAADGECGDGVCYDALTSSGGGPGLCLTACGVDDFCPLGFVCGDVDGSGACLPERNTCDTCSDVDGDGFGIGRCAEGGEPVTPVDCDDLDENAWYDPIDAGDDEHSFPDFCGAIDYNCNGIADDVEQIGSEPWNSAHCTACGDVCQGVIEEGNADRGCRFRVDAMSCVAVCDDPEAWADCNGNIEDGCETAVDDPTRLYYRDADGDGRGNTDEVLFACDPDEIPDGYVAIGGDCLDDPGVAGANTVYGSWSTADGTAPAAVEICDSLDNDCNGSEDDNPVDDGSACADETADFCAEVCVEGELTCQAAGDDTEVCDGRDNDCDGFTDVADLDSFDGEGDFGEACTVPDALGPCSAGFWFCGGEEGLVCESSHSIGSDRPDLEQLDNNCDGIDGDYEDGVFVRGGGTTINSTCRSALTTCTGSSIAASCPTGLADEPLNDIQDAVSLASCLGKDVYVTAGFYSINAEIELADNVGIYGGYVWTSVAGWSRGEGRTEIERDGGLAGDPVISVFVGEDLNASVREVELHSLDLETGDADDGAGQHNIGFICDNCAGVVLADLSIVTGSGGDGFAVVGVGPAGSSGKNASDGSAGGAVRTCNGVNVNGGTGGSSNANNGSGGSGPSGGSRGPNELDNCQIGSCGSDRDSWTNGDHDGGAGGGGGTAASAFEANVEPVFPTRASADSFASASGSAGSRGGPGGGGGGGGHSCDDYDGSDSANGGGGGAGGCGGSGGLGAGQGGHSIALHLTDSTGFQLMADVDLIRGDAGAGGAGQAAGQGGFGGQGADGQLDTNMQVGFYSITECAALTGQNSTGGGGGGGGAGAGGNGGNGGPGGSSFAVVRDNTSRATWSDVAYATWYSEIGMAATVGGGTGAGGLGGSGGLERAQFNGSDPGDGGTGWDGSELAAEDSGGDGGTGAAGNS